MRTGPLLRGLTVTLLRIRKTDRLLTTRGRRHAKTAFISLRFRAADWPICAEVLDPTAARIGLTQPFVLGSNVHGAARGAVYLHAGRPRRVHLVPNTSQSFGRDITFCSCAASTEGDRAARGQEQSHQAHHALDNSIVPHNAHAQPRRAHTLGNSTPYLPPAGGCSGWLGGRPQCLTHNRLDCAHGRREYYAGHNDDIDVIRVS